MEKLPPMISVFFWKDNTWHDTFVEYGMVCTCRVTSSSNPNLWYSGTTLAGLLDLHSRLKLWRSGHWVATFVARCIQADAKDRVGLHQKLDSCMDPMDPERHPDGSIVNVVSGKLAPASVNVDNALIIGQTMLEDFEKAWPERFHCTQKWEHDSIMQFCSDWWLSSIWSQCQLLTGHGYLVTETLMWRM